MSCMVGGQAAEVCMDYSSVPRLSRTAGRGPGSVMVARQLKFVWILACVGVVAIILCSLYVKPGPAHRPGAAAGWSPEHGAATTSNTDALIVATVIYCRCISISKLPELCLAMVT